MKRRRLAVVSILMMMVISAAVLSLSTGHSGESVAPQIPRMRCSTSRPITILFQA